MKSISTKTLEAAKKAISSELKVREDLTPGSYIVDEELHLKLDGSVTVNEPEKYIPTVSIPVKATLALFVRYSGITGDRALAALEMAMTEALKLGDKAEEHIVEIAMLDNAEKKVKKMLGDLPKVDRAGKTIIKVKAVDLLQD
jgi:hypothetical protein